MAANQQRGGGVMGSLIGRENVYTCKRCGGFTVTIDVDDGVTPMFIECRSPPPGTEDCKGMAASAMYPVGPRPPNIPPPAWEWYSPSPNERATLSWGDADHVERGGLLLRARRAS